MVTIVIVSYNTREILQNCLETLYRGSGSTDMEVFVVDNDSRDDSARMVHETFPQVRLIANSSNLGFAAANNQAFALAGGRYIILLNPDAYVGPTSIQNAVTFMDQNPRCGLCGGKIISPEGKLEPSARRFPSPLSKLLTLSGLSGRFPGSPILNRHEFGGFAHDRPLEVDWVPGTFTIIRKKMLEEIGEFDERFFIYYEETDLCLRAKKAGWKIYFIPDAEVMHIGGACSKTRKDKTFDTGASQVLSFRMRSEWLYYRKNYGIIALAGSSGAEIGWYALRYLKNLLILSPEAPRKRAAAASTISQILRSLKETKLGTLSPQTPW
ncbi:MAG: glycosyltransferase family 2 protein [Chlorobium limicola]|uniref:Glycosyl transferase family 2 n=1 Tax=Chlorobium limicola (strain DSM 245 / NBRC 103803 / 6330) TaxID=290315 RepID=B3EF17_CHLL2|nr:glycosyltransferase family 2 protein [Chlorobium limicola]ACD90879.1 glycosyl transferase family 2 [Chlorobium limicola DSM 245]NTV20544.1 glycosyltransferase family 2 protein [Chlorobium limicola]